MKSITLNFLFEYFFFEENAKAIKKFITKILQTNMAMNMIYGTSKDSKWIFEWMILGILQILQYYYIRLTRMYHQSQKVIYMY